MQSPDEEKAVASCSKKVFLFGLSFRYKLVEVAFLMLKLLQRVKVRKVKKVTGELAREEDGGEDLQGEVGGRGGEVEAEKREWKFAEKEGDGKADMIEVNILTDKNENGFFEGDRAETRPRAYSGQVGLTSSISKVFFATNARANFLKFYKDL